MEQFNLEKYKALVAEGKTPKIITRDERSARIVCTDREDDNYSIIALVKTPEGRENCMMYEKNGNFFSYKDSEYDLFFAAPEPTYRPYKDAEECLKAMQAHEFLVKEKGPNGYHLVTTISPQCVWLGSVQIGISFSELFKDFEFMNGSPCGVKENES